MRRRGVELQAHRLAVRSDELFARPANRGPTQQGRNTRERAAVTRQAGAGSAASSACLARAQDKEGEAQVSW
jgi:hypothetical protein